MRTEQKINKLLLPDINLDYARFQIHTLGALNYSKILILIEKLKGRVNEQLLGRDVLRKELNY